MMTSGSENARLKGFNMIMQGAYLRRLKDKANNSFVEIRLTDEELLLSVRSVIDGMLSENMLDERATPVAQKVSDQLADEKRAIEGGRHLLLTLDESVVFFSLLSELDEIVNTPESQIQ